MTKVIVSAVQYSYKPINSFEDFASNVENLVNQAKGSEFIVFPEVFTMELHYITPNKDMNKIHEFTEQYIQLFEPLSKKNNIIIIAGSHLTLKNNKLFNRCYVFCPDGSILTHDKTHLFPIEAPFVTPGNKFEVFETEKVKFSIATCYEMEFPEVARILTLKGAEIIFCPSYTVGEHGFWRVRHCAQARAIENQIYTVHSCMVGTPILQGMEGYGRSSILSPCEPPWPLNGIIAEAKTNEEMVITGELDIKLLHRKRKRGAALNLKFLRPELYKINY